MRSIIVRFEGTTAHAGDDEVHFTFRAHTDEGRHRVQREIVELPSIWLSGGDLLVSTETVENFVANINRPPLAWLVGVSPCRRSSSPNNLRLA